MEQSKRRLLQQAWHEYAEHVLPTDAPAVQTQETKRAFYAGAIAMFHTIIAQLSPEPETTEMDLTLMENLDAEMKDWGRAVAEGRA